MKEPPVEKAQKKMFKAVGRKWTPEAAAHENWFRETKWTRAQEVEFKSWLVRGLLPEYGCA
jgi:hypothetical protein